MNKIPFHTSIRFYLLFFAVLSGVIIISLALIESFGMAQFLTIPLAVAGIILVWAQIFFILHRFNKKMALLLQTIQMVVKQNFSRKFKLHILKPYDEIGLISKEVSVMLNKLHQRTTEVLVKRKELTEAGKNIEKLGAIGRNITSCLSLEEIIQTTFTNINQLLDMSLLAIGIYNHEQQNMTFYGMRQSSDKVLTGTCELNDPKQWSVYCFSQQKEIFCNEYDQCCGMYFSSTLFNEPDEKRESFIYLPLTHRNERIGVFTLQSFNRNAYTPYHLNLLRNLANYIIVALSNAKTFAFINEQKNALQKAKNDLQIARDSLEIEVTERTKEILRQKQEIENKNIELERLSLVARKTDNAIMIMDAHGNIEWINQCFTRIYQYTYPEFIEKRGRNILQTSFCPNIKEHLEQCIAQKKSVYYEALNITGNGQEIWTQTTLTPVLDANCNISHLLAIDLDITQRKHVELKLTSQSKAITQSIMYARQIQNAVLPPIEWFENALSESFVLYKPKDIVSGDFYWFGQRNNKILIALADCTGHGVPGAFTSMLGISLLNEIVRSADWQNAGSLLNILRQKIKYSLRQNIDHYEISDGMDISLCIIDKKNAELEFAGANQSLFQINNSELIELKGDKMPIGLYVNDNRPFETQKIKIQKDAKFYLSTDGYFDQFGGFNDKKFMLRRFKELLHSIHSKPFNMQHNILNETFEIWKGSNRVQIDDISIIGFRV